MTVHSPVNPQETVHQRAVTGDAAMTGIYAVSAVVSIGLLIAAAVLKKRKRVL